LDEWELITGKDSNISPCHHINTALWPTQPPIQWVMGVHWSRVWSWLLISTYCWVWECVELYLHSPIHLHGIVLN